MERSARQSRKARRPEGQRPEARDQRPEAGSQKGEKRDMNAPDGSGERDHGEDGPVVCGGAEFWGARWRSMDLAVASLRVSQSGCETRHSALVCVAGMALEAVAADLSVAAWVDSLQAGGRYTFTHRDLRQLSGRSAVAIAAALRRLKKGGRLQCPRRGFFVIVPVEYRSAGCPPASWFVADLMRFLDQRYYVGILSAAALHGAAHQQPMTFQVVTERVTRTASAGRVRIEFHKSRIVQRMPVIEMPTDTGTMRVASPELTAFDLVRYPAAAGYWSNIATVLGELAERMQPEALAGCAKLQAVPDVQRLGYVLASLDRRSLADVLAARLEGERVRSVLLATKHERGRARPHPKWRVTPNVEIEVDQ